ncbi:hypothetical protein C3L33_06292, partial [Rhododendron williamsianum]
MQTRYMERSNSMAREKRALDPTASEEGQRDQKRPALASVIVEALKVDSLQKLCSSLEPILRRVVSEEVERALAKLHPAKLNARASPKRIEGPDGRNLQLHFRSRLSLPLFTGGKVEGEQGAAIHIVLLDVNTGHVVTSGPESSVKLDVVVLEGDFNNEDEEGWSQDDFESHIVKEREGKRPLLTGDLQILGSGMSNKMWEVLLEHAKTCVLSGKLYVYYSDDVRNVGVVFNNIYELSGLIAGGQFCSVDSLSDSQKVYVDSLVKKAYDNWMHVIEYDGKSLLGFKQNQNSVASQSDITHFISSSQPADQYFATTQPPRSDNALALGPPESSMSGFQTGGTSNFSSYRGLEDFFPEEEIRMRSHEMLENEDMQHLLRIFNMGGHGQGHASVNTSNNGYSYPSAAFMPNQSSNYVFDDDRTRSSGKAVVGWLKLKAALRWGIFIRKKAAERGLTLLSWMIYRHGVCIHGQGILYSRLLLQLSEGTLATP